MEFVWFIVIGLASGVLAGMGMGGGTLLIPLLTIFMQVNQQLAQGINLIVFIPLSVVVLIIYAKKKLLKFNGVWFIIIPAVLVSAIGSLFAIKIQGKTLSLIFGIFLIVLGVFMTVSTIIGQIKNKNTKN